MSTVTRPVAYSLRRRPHRGRRPCANRVSKRHVVAGSVPDSVRLRLTDSAVPIELQIAFDMVRAKNPLIPAR